MGIKKITKRTRTVSWEDPKIGAEAATEMSGLDFLRAMASGEAPATAEAHLTDEAGKLYAHATTTCIIFRGDGR